MVLQGVRAAAGGVTGVTGAVGGVRRVQRRTGVQLFTRCPEIGQPCVCVRVAKVAGCSRGKPQAWSEEYRFMALESNGYIYPVFNRQLPVR
jgi:hypothetical protein